MRGELAGNVAEATSNNRAATVAVTATGALQSMRLNDRIKQLGPAQVAASVMEAYQKASREALARTAEITGREIGEDRARAMLRDLLNRDLPDDDADGPSRA